MIGTLGHLDPVTLQLADATDCHPGPPAMRRTASGPFQITNSAGPEMVSLISANASSGAAEQLRRPANGPVPLILDARVIAVGYERFWISAITSGTSIHNRGGNPQNRALGVVSMP